MTDTPQERRRFKRIPFDASTELRQGEHRWPVTLLDLSLKGLLVGKPAAWHADAEAPFSADIHLADDALVTMELRLAHDEEHQLGFKCEHIDLDSITHLRRVIELNLGDPAALERELGELTSAG
jgi:hypothetical protein